MHLIDSSSAEIAVNNKPLIVGKKKTPTYHGSYHVHSGNITILAAAHGATAGFMILWNPLASGKTIKITKLDVKNGMTTALATPTAPRVTFEKFTSSTNASGAVLTVARGKTADVTNVLYVSLATTGLTIANQQVIGATIIGANATGTANIPPFKDDIVKQGEDAEDFELAAGEGILIRQADAGTASDTRKMIVDAKWVEFT